MFFENLKKGLIEINLYGLLFSVKFGFRNLHAEAAAEEAEASRQRRANIQAAEIQEAETQVQERIESATLKVEAATKGAVLNALGVLGGASLVEQLLADNDEIIEKTLATAQEETELSQMHQKNAVQLMADAQVRIDAKSVIHR